MSHDDSWAPIREYTPVKRRRRFPWEVGVAGVVVIGLLAWFLVPAYLGSKQAGEEKAIVGHLFKLVAGADQFFLENPGRIFVRYDEIVGPAGRLKEPLAPVAGENYATLFPLRRDHPEVSVRTRDGRRVIWFMHPGQGGWIERGALVDRARGDLIGEEDVIKAYRKFLETERPDGVHEKKFPDDSRFETTYRDGVPHGPFKAWRPDGKPWGEATYENGRLSGPSWNQPADGSARFDEARAPDYAQAIKGVR